MQFKTQVAVTETVVLE